MALDKRLLEILVCPVTKAPVQLLSRDRLAILNRSIEQGEITSLNGSAIEAPIEEALITTDGKTIYRVEAGIPVMLEEEAITARQVAGW
jgi:uncharacterized protein YbaR (Trm112 family)